MRVGPSAHILLHVSTLEPWATEFFKVRTSKGWRNRTALHIHTPPDPQSREPRGEREPMRTWDMGLTVVADTVEELQVFLFECIEGLEALKPTLPEE